MPSQPTDNNPTPTGQSNRRSLLLVGASLLIGLAIGIPIGLSIANNEQDASELLADSENEPIAASNETTSTTGQATENTPSPSTSTSTSTPPPEAPETPVVVDEAGLVWGKDATPPVLGRTKPEILVDTTDPTYSTTVRRLTSAAGTRFNRNTYSRRQAENADGTLFFTYHGDAEYRVYDRLSGELVQAMDIHPDAEPQWHPTDPNRIRSILGPNSSVGDLKLYETDLVSNTEVAIADLTDRVQAVWPSALYMKDNAEGSPSSDGSRYAWIVFDTAEDAVGLVSYDLETDELLGFRDIRTDAGRLDWVSTSVTGSYVVAGYTDGTFVYSTTLDDERKINNKADHSDLALDAAGGDTYVYIDFSTDVDGGWLVAVDLATLDRTRIFDIYDNANSSIHISGKGYDKPGWIVASTYNCKVPGAWTCDKVFAVELAAGGRILNLAHTYNCGEDYWTETQAVVNRGFTRVYFNSDGGSCGIDAEVYELAVPAF